MKKILFFLLFPFLLFSQNLSFRNYTTVNVNDKLINKLIKRQNLIKSFNNKTVFYIPYEKTFLPNVKNGIFVNGEFIQYEWIYTGTWDIQIYKPKTKYYKIDLTKKKNKIEKDKKEYSTDDLDILKPKDLKQQVKNKIKVKP